MEYRTLDLTIICADDIKNVKFFTKMSVYVMVSLMGQTKTKKKTHIHKKCGTSPRWNHRTKFTIDESSLSNPNISLLFQVKCESFFHGNKDIGEVCVPLRELFNEDNGVEESAEKVVDYQVRTPSGKPKGTFKFSYKFGEKFTQDMEAANKKTHEPVTAYPATTPSSHEGGGMAYAAYTGNGYAAMPPAPAGYPQHPQSHGGYPPQGYAAYSGGAGPYMYPPPSGYGYPPPPPQGYGYPPPPMQQHVQHPARNMMGMGGGGAGLGMGLAGGLLGGMLLGEMASDLGDMGGYDGGMGMDGF